MTWFARALATLGLAGPLLCCSLALSPEGQQCASDDDCRALGGAFASTACVESTCQSIAEASSSSGGSSSGGEPADAGPDAIDKSDPLWCLGSIGYVPPDPSRRLTLTQQFVRQIDKTPIKAGEATIKLCALSDLACTSPRATVEPDDQGYVRVDVEYGFAGYFDFVSEGLQSSIMVINQLTADSEGPPLQALNPATAQYLASTLLGSDVTVEPTLAHSIMAVEDCNGQRFAGISYQAAVVDAQNRTRVFYILNPGVPTPGGTETNNQGQGGFINLPPGIGTMTGVYNLQQKRVVRIDLPLRANYFSYGLLRPQDFR